LSFSTEGEEPAASASRHAGDRARTIQPSASRSHLLALDRHDRHDRPRRPRAGCRCVGERDVPACAASARRRSRVSAIVRERSQGGRHQRPPPRLARGSPQAFNGMVAPTSIALSLSSLNRIPMMNSETRWMLATLTACRNWRMSITSPRKLDLIPLQLIDQA